MQQAPAASNETRLPRAVLRRSRAIEARLAAQREPGDPAPAAQLEPPVTPDPKKVAPPVDPKTPAAAAQDPRENDPLYWKHRFSVVSGVLRSERQEREEQVDGLHQQIAKLQGDLAEANAKTLTSPSSSKTDPGRYFTPEQIEQIGEEQATAVAAAADKAAQEAARQAVEQMNALVKPLQDRQAQDAQRNERSRKQEFTDQLAELVPDYTEIDTSEGWQAWLAEFSEELGEVRQDTLNRHVGRLNAPSVARMFNAYKATLKTPEPPITPHGEGANTGGDPPPQPSAGALRPPTDAEVKDFYKRAATGKVLAQERVEFEARRKLRVGRPIAV